MADDPVPPSDPSSTTTGVPAADPSAAAPVDPLSAAPVDAAADATPMIDPEALAAALGAQISEPYAPAEGAAVDRFAAALSGSGEFDQSAIDELLKQANFEDHSALPADAA